MPPRQDDDVDWRSGDRAAGARRSSGGRRLLPVAGGFALAIAATLAVFLTDNPQYLRVAVVAVAWAFVLATFAVGRRQAERVAAAAREDELHRAYEYELAREVAARREVELEVENEIRRETEDAMRAELDALRADLGSLTGLREELARVAELRGELRALGALRDEVARVASLRDDVAALTALRAELGQVAELRGDLGRLRVELLEQLASELRVERITMRTQASRLPAEPSRAEPPAGRTVEGTTSWTDGVPPRELTGGWPAARLDEPLETRGFEPARARSWDAAPPAPQAPVAPSTTSWPATPPPWEEPAPRPAEPAPRSERPSWDAEPARWSAEPAPEPARLDPRPSRPAPWPSRPSPAEPPPYAPPAVPPPNPPTATPPSSATATQQPIEWLAARSLLDARPPAPEPPATSAYSAVAPSSSGSAADRPGGTSGGLRVSEILAENGMNPPTGGRRRRRYRDEDTSDDVLSRVLGRN